MKIVRKVPTMDLEAVESFLVNLNGGSHYRLLSMSRDVHGALPRRIS
jgi:hypothetical protein